MCHILNMNVEPAAGQLSLALGSHHLRHVNVNVTTRCKNSDTFWIKQTK